MQVMDLSEGHVSALQYIQNAEPARNTYSVFNLGKGQGYSVLDMVRTMQEASGREIKLEFADRRPGDIAICYADPAKATKELHWTAKRSLEDSCRGMCLRRYKCTFPQGLHHVTANPCTDSWNWISHNPDGYRGGEKK
jgi:UDP-glucose 4-epimerase